MENVELSQVVTEIETKENVKVEKTTKSKLNQATYVKAFTNASGKLTYANTTLSTYKGNDCFYNGIKVGIITLTNKQMGYTTIDGVSKPINHERAATEKFANGDIKKYTAWACAYTVSAHINKGQSVNQERTGRENTTTQERFNKAKASLELLTKQLAQEKKVVKTTPKQPIVKIKEIA